MILVFCFNLLTKKGPIIYNIQGIVGTIGIISVFFFTQRFHPEVFKIFFNAVLLIYGPHVIHLCGDGVLGAWIASQSHPTLIYLVTGSIWHFMFHLGTSQLLVNFFYKDLMIESVAAFPPIEFVESLVHYSNEKAVYGLACTILTHEILQNAYYYISVVDKKKEEFERQKNFILGFSHELRNIINSMMGNIKLATFETSTEKVKELLHNAEVCTEVLLHLVNNILDSGKLQIGDLEITPSPVRIYDAMENVWAICSDLIKRKNLIGRMRIKKDIPKVLMLDHYRLTQVFLNLVGNAVKFTDHGTIDVSIEWMSNVSQVTDSCFEPLPFNLENDQDEGTFEKSQALSILDDSQAFLNFSHTKIKRSVLTPKIGTTKGILKIIVADSGVGMDKEDTKKLFQKFSQVTSDASKKKLGTGLGLFITKELCTGMGGEIKVFSKKDKGTAFILCLPMEPVKGEEISSSLDIESTKGLLLPKNLRALVVDDEQFCRVILTNFLKKIGISSIDSVDNGLKAYERFKDQKIGEHINIVTLDLDMPVMNGKLAAQKIREFEVSNNLKPCFLTIVSANCMESEINECVNKNGRIRANIFLKKPVKIDELCHVIASQFLKESST